MNPRGRLRVDTRVMNWALPIGQIDHFLRASPTLTHSRSLFWISFLMDLQHRSHLDGPEISSQKNILKGAHTTTTTTDRSGLDLTSPRTHSKTVKSAHLAERSSQNGSQKWPSNSRNIPYNRAPPALSSKRAPSFAFGCFSKRRLRRKN